MNELADLYLALGKEEDAFALSERTLDIELEVMGEQDPMTLQTMFRIGKLHYLANRKDAAMEALGDTLAKQEKLLGFDNAEATKTRDLLNEILSERVTSRVLEENLLVYEEETIIGPQLPTVLADFDKNESSEKLTGEVKADSNQSDNSDQLQSDFLKGLTVESEHNQSDSIPLFPKD